MRVVPTSWGGGGGAGKHSVFYLLEVEQELRIAQAKRACMQT